MTVCIIYFNCPRPHVWLFDSSKQVYTNGQHQYEVASEFTGKTPGYVFKLFYFLYH